MTRAEQETVIRWAADDRLAWLWTAEEAQARRWTRLGYEVTLKHGTWWARVPAVAIRFRPVKDGSVVKRKATGTPFGPRIRGGTADDIHEPTSGLDPARRVS